MVQRRQSPLWHLHATISFARHEWCAQCTLIPCVNTQKMVTQHVPCLWPRQKRRTACLLGNPFVCFLSASQANTSDAQLACCMLHFLANLQLVPKEGDACGLVPHMHRHLNKQRSRVFSSETMKPHKSPTCHATHMKTTPVNKKRLWL